MLSVATPSTYTIRHVGAFKSGHAREFQAQSRGGCSVAEWSADGRYLATAGEDRHIKLWSTDRLITGGRSSSASMSFDVGQGACIMALAWPQPPAGTLAPVGPAAARGTAASPAAGPGSRGKSTANVPATPAKSGRAGSAAAAAAAAAAVASTAGMPDGFATGSNLGRLDLWGLRQAKPSTSVSLGHTPVSLSYIPQPSNTSATARPILVSLANNVVQIIDPRMTSRPLASYTSPTRVNATAVDTALPDRPRVLLGLEDGTIQVNDLRDLGTASQTVVAHLGPCTALALDPMGRYVASGGHDSLVTLYERDTMLPARVLKYDEDQSIRCLSFSHDGEFLSAAADAGSVPTVRLCITSSQIFD
ncbi:hypothetical protein GGF32_007338 [Allomyces javanicus]|nr:hypothetical protein GGF32_007338 [Allomyces javanicus]